MQSDGWVKRLETLEKEMMIPNDSSNDPAVNRMSIRVVDTADSARSTRDSILSLYGHRSYYHKILDPREGPFALALELQADYSRVSRIIDDHLEDDLLPVEAASNAMDTGLDVHASASIKSYDDREQFLWESHDDPEQSLWDYANMKWFDDREQCPWLPGPAIAVRDKYPSKPLPPLPDPPPLEGVEVDH